MISLEGRADKICVFKRKIVRPSHTFNMKSLASKVDTKINISLLKSFFVCLRSCF